MAEQAKPGTVLKGQVGPAHPAGNPHKVFLATPAYGSAFSAEYVRSFFLLLSSRPNPPVEYLFSYHDYADIVIARNYLISDFYFNHPDYSHILFIDDDMGFDAGLIGDMLGLGEPVVGTIAPKRRVDLRKLHAAKGMPFANALARSVEFIGDIRKPVERRGDFVSMTQCGAGILLISRKCLDIMIARLPEIVDTRRFKKLSFASRFTRFLTPFDKIRTDEFELSEDFSFCKRWVEGCGGKIWAHTNRNIRHAGKIVVDSKYADSA